MLKQIVLFSIFFSLTTHLFSQNFDAYYKSIVKTLCSEYFSGRGYVDGGDSIAADFIVEEFRKNGLKPITKTYFQRFKFQVNSFPSEVVLSNENKVLKPGIHYLIDASCPSFYSIVKPKLLQLDDMLNGGNLLHELETISFDTTYNSVAISLVGLKGDTLEQIQNLAYGLVESLPVFIIKDSKLMWSVGRGQYRFPLIELQDSVFKANSSWNLRIDAKLKDHYTQNVIGWLPAKKSKNKPTVFITAHYDHLGRMGENTLFPGANDNASGTAMLLALSMMLEAKPLDVNIVFVAFAGEEAGLLGSKFFTENPTVKLNQIDFLLNLDIMGSGDIGIRVVNGVELSDYFQRLLTINDTKKYLNRIQPRNLTRNSDHYWFTMKEVPSFFVYTEGDNKNYHDIFDTAEGIKYEQTSSLRNLFYDFIKTFEKKGQD